jgi:molecular chaperone GrpE
MTKIKKTAKDKNLEKNKELEGQLKRALADYQNLERRVEEERRLLSSLSSAVLIEKFLPVLDNLENAQKHLNDEGLEMVIKQFTSVLEEEGVTEIEAIGTQFDPNLHEATEVVEGAKDNQVVKILRKGYKINDRVIRPVQVSVERNSQDKTQPDQVQEVLQNE